MDNKLNYRLINITVVVAFLYFLINSLGLWMGVLSKAIYVLEPFIIGFAFAYAFTPLVRFLTKKGVKRNLSIIIVIIGIILFLGLFLYITLPLLYDQLSLLVKMSIQLLNNLRSNYDINLGNYSIKIVDFLNSLLKDVGSIVSNTGIDIINKSIGFISKFIVGVVAFIYFLIYMDTLRGYLKNILEESNTRFFEYFKLMDNEITNYVKGLEMFMVIQFIEYSTLFFIIGHPNWLILGILACVTTIIPYFGGLITNVIAIILACVVSPKLVILTVIICLIFPQVDGYVISPKIYGKTNKINPLITIMVVSIGGTLAGIAGIIAGLPCFLLLRITYTYFKSDFKKSIGIKEKV